MAKKKKITTISAEEMKNNTIGIEELVPMVNSVNPETLQKNAKDLAEANFVLNQFNNELMIKLADKDKQIQHLQDMLTAAQGIPLITSDGLVPATPELLLIEQQLKKLLATSMTRELTLDESRRFDIFIKNKNLILEKPTEISAQKKPAKEKTQQELLTVAAKKTTEEKN